MLFSGSTSSCWFSDMVSTGVRAAPSRDLCSLLLPLVLFKRKNTTAVIMITATRNRVMYSHSKSLDPFSVSLCLVVTDLVILAVPDVRELENGVFGPLCPPSNLVVIDVVEVLCVP